MHHLTSMDASFLHFETPETPMHVASLLLLDLPKGYKGDYYEDFKAMIGKRMHLASVFTRKLAPMPFELAEPVWIAMPTRPGARARWVFPARCARLCAGRPG